MFKFFKQSSEQYPIAVDFSEVLATGETITAKDVSAIVFIGTAGTATSTVIASSAISSDNVNVTVKAGTSGLTYKITVKITTSALNVYEEDVLMEVIDK